MQHLTSTEGLRETLSGFRRQGHSIALVPTMGNLHTGHIHLVETARAHADIVVSTIFVNPMQFGKNEDLDSYPRTLEQDKEKLSAAQCDVLFTPSVDEMYPTGHENNTVVSVPKVSQRYCGSSRPRHFDGVSTIVSKLFNIVQPDTALFGLKDYQQFLVIQKMVSDLCMPVALIGVPTQREASGLALSSRNGYLTAAEKKIATALIETLRSSAHALENGDPVSAVETQANQRLTKAGFTPDYFSVCQAHTLNPATQEDTELVILAAAYLGKTRLIDNIRVQRPVA